MGRGRGGLESEAMSSVRPPMLRRVVRVLTRGGTRPVLTAGCSGGGGVGGGGGAPDSGGSRDPPPSKYAPDPTAEAGSPPPHGGGVRWEGWKIGGGAICHLFRSKLGKPRTGSPTRSGGKPDQAPANNRSYEEVLRTQGGTPDPDGGGLGLDGTVSGYGG